MTNDTADAPLVQPHEADSGPRPFFVGIGSSAGGLEALSAFLPGLPAGLGLCYVVVQHMSPTHRSMMTHLLGRTTAMEVLEVTDGCVPLPDKVYVTPPNHNVMLHEDGSLRLLEPPNETVPKPSVNLFFSSLAEVVGDRAIGVVLSGTGSDGAIGLHAIKAAGGYAFAQEPGGAKYDGMVRAAIEAGGVDWVLPAESMGAEIARIVQRQRAAEGRGSKAANMPPATLRALLHNLYAHTRIDFTGYKEATLLRRIERRMTSTGCLTMDQYVEFTRVEPKELQTLSQDMLISVTSFFRDRVAFDRLREEVVRLLEKKPIGEDVRVWVAGCASGEEAYSVGMVLIDALSGQRVSRRVQIFASDIDEAALARARRAVFPASLLSELDPTTLDRHFVRHPDGYEASKALRNMVMFARHNVVQDPPFVRLDLVSCRNVLIYLQPPLQDRLMKTFHYALNPGGLLFLGRSEGMHGSDSHFEPIDRNAHLFRRGSGVPRMPSVTIDRDRPAARAKSVQATLEDLVLQATMQRFAPACVLVDAAGDVQHLKGDLAGLMSLPDGRPGFALMGLLRRELRPELARLIRSARDASPQRLPGARAAMQAVPAPAPVLGRWRVNRAISADTAVRMSVQLLANGQADGQEAPMLLVCFERRPAHEVSAPPAAEGDEGTVTGTSALEEELAATREHLYTVIEELETSNEEAQSLNEEIQTANEELQSTNEELEASNEELQASNEELTTVNEELQVKSVEWQALNAELEGIYSSVDFPLLAFNDRLELTRTNLAAQQQLGIETLWLGKPAHQLPWPKGMPTLHTDVEQVQSLGKTHVRQLEDMDARHWVLRIMPRMAADGSRRGVLIQMEDNTRLRESEGAALRSDALMRQLVTSSAQLVCICDPSGRLQMANPEFERCHRLPAGSAAGKLLVDVLPPGRAQAFRAAQIDAMRRLAPIEVEETVEVAGERRDLLASYHPLLDDNGAVSGVCYQALDVTRRKQAESDLLAANSAKLAAEGMARTKSSFLANMSHEIRTPMNAVLGLSRMVLEGELPDAAREQVGKIHEAAQALTRILDDVLDFSKIEAGELRFEHRPFGLDEVLRGVKNLFSANAQQKGLAIALDLPLGVPLQLLGDRLRLSQVLNNLVGNAIKFTEKGEVRISVSALEATSPDECHLRFTVRDTGIGIAPAVSETLFEAFMQGDGSITRRFGGTGLGLAICRRLVALMGGRIGVNSAPSQGSEFWFSASFAVADPQVPSQVQSSTPFRSSFPSILPAPLPAPLPSADGSLRGGRAVLAEDNALNQIVGRAVLEKIGLEVYVVADGAEALELIGSHPVGHFSAVLMDMHMPVMDGLEATRRLRATPQGAALPIVALTAAALSEDRERCMAAGMDAHIAKPLEPEHLLQALQTVTQRRTKDPQAQTDPLSTATPQQPVSGLPLLPGFDLRPLYDRLQQDERLVWELLEDFVAQEQVTADELSRLLADQRTEDVRLRTHALLGSALTIGATLVARTCAGLEASLHAGLIHPAMLHPVREALKASLTTAQEALSSRPH